MNTLSKLPVSGDCQCIQCISLYKVLDKSDTFN